MEKDQRRKMNGWEFLTVAIVYLPIIWLVGKWIDRKTEK